MDERHEELLRLLRAGVTDVAVRQATTLWDEVAAATGRQSADLDPADVRTVIREACAKYLDEDRDVTVAMIEDLVAGQWRHMRPITRPRARDIVKSHLERSRPQTADLTVRSIEKIEQTKIAPRVNSAIIRYFEDLPRNVDTNSTSYDWYNCEVELSARPETKIIDTFALRVTYNFRSKVGPMYFAVTEDEDLADAICYRHPSIADTFVPSKGCAASVRVAVRWDDSGKFEGIESTIIDDRSVPTDIAELRSVDVVKIYAFYPDLSHSGVDARFRVVSEQIIRLDENYCYWSAPRSLHLTAVKVDFSGFPDRDLYSLRLLRHLAFPVEDYSDPEAGYFELTCNERLRSGGVSVRIDWSQKSKQQ
ncbi:hypothetical protein ACFYTF_29060 [Nocardia thailandica]|uniref:Uncharacterized protein n=1 Tax=Nocardia thailandica TaxID=257275 RepID=A0ABW6PX05_9NOCA